MNFLSKKILEFQEKKLKESEKTLHVHLNNKKRLEASDGSSKEIEHGDKLIKIWSNNIEKINAEMRKIQEK